MSDEHPQDDYLWDGGGTPDEEVVRLERQLARYQGQPALPPLPARRVRVTRPILNAAMQVGVAAASIALVAAAAWHALSIREAGWSVQSLAGAPVIAGVPIGTASRLPIGQAITTDERSRARIDVSTIGYVEVEPNSVLRLLVSRAREHRLALDRGLIRARIWAPPNLFFVNTPSSTAIDLGCAYTLQVDERGFGRIAVESGWVAFEHKGRESFIPQNAICQTRPGVGPGTPCYADAPETMQQALTILDFDETDDVKRAAALDVVLSSAREKDAFTLWHLLRRVKMDERGRVYDRLASLVPPPPQARRDRVLAGDRRALDAWWDAFQLDSASWWRRWEHKW